MQPKFFWNRLNSFCENKVKKAQTQTRGTKETSECVDERREGGTAGREERKEQGDGRTDGGERGPEGWRNDGSMDG